MAERTRWRRRRVALVLALVTVIGLGVAAFFMPYLLKRYIERNSEAWIDRKITIGSIVLNPFSGVYAVNDLVCYEPRSEVVFVSFDKLGVKGNVLDGLRNAHWEFRDAELRSPYVRIVQTGERFNFSDLLELGGDEEQTEEMPAEKSSELFFSVDGLDLSTGRIDYSSDLLRAPLHVIDLDAYCTRITSEQARMDVRVGFGLPDGMRLDGGFMIDTDSLIYAVEAHLRSFDLAATLPYLQDFFKVGSLGGHLDLDFHVKQSYADESDLALSARMGLRDLAMHDPQNELLLQMRHLEARLDTLVGERFDLGLVDLDGLEARFALLADGTDNWTRLLQLIPDPAAAESEGMVLDASESNVFVLLAEYISYLGKAFTASDYTADSLVFHNGRLLYEDHSMPRSFRYDIAGIDIRAQRFNTQSSNAPITAKARLNGVGSFDARADFDPRDLRNVQLKLQVDSLLMTHLDPYMRWYAAHPAEDGVLAYTGITTIKEGLIDSKNHLRIDRLRFGKKTEEHDTGIVVLPLRLATSLLKDVKGVIELDIPVTGDLRDPQFRVWPIVWQVLKNLLVKVASAPVRLIAAAFQGGDEKELEIVRFRELQGPVENAQQRTLRQLAKALASKPELVVYLVPVVDSVAEAGQLAIHMAKARYLFPAQEVLSAADSVRVRELAGRDSSFVRWMDERMPGTAERSMMDRSMALVGKAEVQARWVALEQGRRDQVMQTLLAAGVEPDRVRFRRGTAGEVTAYFGAPGYRFIYDVVE